MRASIFSLVEMNDDGDAVKLIGVEDVLVLFGHADPIGEPVVVHGSFVMNTRQDIMEAQRDYMAGLFDAPAA
jgi:hypothetical protein